jgi:hypothetical protein
MISIYGALGGGPGTEKRFHFQPQSGIAVANLVEKRSALSRRKLDSF